MDDSEGRDAFRAALNNHYFVLQSAASSTISESGTRASLYVLALSSTLVAVGFVSQARSALGPFLAVVLPTLFILGLFTVVRLVDTGVENVTYLRSMARVRRYYAGLAPEAQAFFGSEQNDVGEALTFLAVGTRRSAWLYTIATMIAVVNSTVAGAGATLLVAHLAGGPERALGLELGCGVAVGLLLVAAFLVYQDRRYRVLAETATPAPRQP
jgi:hypothetical protein